MLDDETIAAGLAGLRPVTYAKVPVEGEWREPPFEDRSHAGRTLAVLCDDPGISALAVDRDSGEVLLIDPDKRLLPVNTSIAQLVACAGLFERAVHDANRLEERLATGLAADEPYERLEAVGERLAAAIGAVDPGAVADEEWFWTVTAEQLGYGL